MPLLRSFHLSTYLTLGMAVLCLGYSEDGLLPEAPYITGFVLLLVAIAYRMEGRWALSLSAANVVGGGLALLLVGWISLQFLRKESGTLDRLPFPVIFLPFLGPVLMILIPTKMFRPKHVGDYWAMQGIGLLAVALGCAMANDMFFGVLLIVYLFCFVWSMALFHLYREIRPQTAEPSAAFDHSRQKLYMFRAARRWAAGIVAAGLLLFLLTPRPSGNRWELPMAGRGRMEVGLSDTALDLNRTGTLEENNEVAFVVQAEDADGNPKLDISPNQRWRVGVRVQYENGRWPPDRGSGLTLQERTLPGSIANTTRKQFNPDTLWSDQLPDFGPDTFYLKYTLQRGVGSNHPLADPIMWRARQRPPIALIGVSTTAVQQRADGSFDWLRGGKSDGPSYVQATIAPSEPDLGPPLQVAVGYRESLSRLSQQPMAERLRHFTAGILERFVQAGSVPAIALTDVDPFTGQSRPQYHETIARAVSAHLANSGEYKYSMDLVRRDRGIDPIEDFLYNTKAGHCQRFATALVLMLRSQGVPAQMVVGYRGCDSRHDGTYEVRQSSAHTWVEVLIPRAGSESSGLVHHWLSLDPTPAAGQSKDGIGSLSDWLESTRVRGESFFRNFILGYDSAARERAAEAVANGLEEFKNSALEGEITWPTAIGGAIVVLAGGVVCLRIARRHRKKVRVEATAATGGDEIAPFHSRLLAVLARHGRQPLSGQTAFEFTAIIAGELAEGSATAAVADVPLRLADAYYRVRFGSQELSESEKNDLDQSLRHLEIALDGHSRQVSASPTRG